MLFHSAPVSRGIAVGSAFVFESFTPQITRHEIKPGEVENGISAFHRAKELAEAELVELRDTLTEEDGDKAGIFGAHIDILGDFAMIDEIEALIRNECYAPEWAIETIYEKFIQILSDIDDDIIRERCIDLKDVKNRILRLLLGEDKIGLGDIQEPSIVFAHDLLPSDTASMNREMVLAIVSEIGGATSHSAILARSYEIPALLGITGVLGHIKTGDKVIVDALDGVLILEPTEEQLSEYAQKAEKYRQELEALKKYQTVEPVTSDGKRMQICLNIGGVSSEELAAESFVDGVGLFRSEFLFMAGKDLPSENQQFQVYKKAAETFGDRQVILRTLDIGGDKTLECMELPREDNPFLGCRALRLCFRRTDLFKTQLRAALRASVFGNLAIMFPMVGSIEDWRRAKAILDEVKAGLIKDDIPFNENIQVGIMIEIPAIAAMADLIAKEVDFASVGTNDLCQYLMAVDRLNPEVSSYYQSYHPAMFRMINQVAKAFESENKTLSICGEMAGDPMAALVFMGMGIRKLSMVAGSVAPVKKMVIGTDIQTAQRVLADVINMSTAPEIENYLESQMSRILAD